MIGASVWCLKSILFTPPLEILPLFFRQSFAPDGRGVGSGPAASEAVSPGSAQQVAGDPAVVRNASRPGECVFCLFHESMIGNNQLKPIVIH